MFMHFIYQLKDTQKRPSELLRSKGRFVYYYTIHYMITRPQMPAAQPIMPAAMIMIKIALSFDFSDFTQMMELTNTVMIHNATIENRTIAKGLMLITQISLITFPIGQHSCSTLSTPARRPAHLYYKSIIMNILRKRNLFFKILTNL